MAATITSDFSAILPPGIWGYRLTTTATTETFEAPCAEVVACVANNETDDDGVGVAVEAIPASGRTQTITLTVGNIADVVTLLIVGRK